MNMKKTIAAVAASAMAISAVAVPANAAVENAAATGTSFTYSLVKEYTVDAASASATIVSTFQADPTTDYIKIDFTGVDTDAPITVTAIAADGSRFKPLTFVATGNNASVNLGAGYALTSSSLTIDAGIFSQIAGPATFTVTASIPAWRLASYERTSQVKTAAAGWLNVTTANSGGTAAQPGTLTPAAEDTARQTGILNYKNALITSYASGAQEALVAADALAAMNATASPYTVIGGTATVALTNTAQGNGTDAAYAASAITTTSATASFDDDANAFTPAVTVPYKTLANPTGDNYESASSWEILADDKTAYDAVYAQGMNNLIATIFANNAAAITAAGEAALQAARDAAGTPAVPGGVPGSGAYTTATGYYNDITSFTPTTTKTVKRPYKSFLNGVNDGPYDIITWLSTKVPAAMFNDVYRWEGDTVIVNGQCDANTAEKVWLHVDAGVRNAGNQAVLEKIQMLDFKDQDGDGDKLEPAMATNAYYNVSAVLNDCIANYDNVTFTFNTATASVLTADTMLNNAWNSPSLTDTYTEDWAGSTIYKTAFAQGIYNNYGSDTSNYVPFDPNVYFTNGIGYNLFSGALVLNDAYSMQLADTEVFSYNATSLVFDYQAVKDAAYANYNTYLDMIWSMKLATSVPWYWDSMTVSFANDEGDTADSAAGTTSDDEVLADELTEDPGDAVETLPVEEAPVTEAPVTEAPVAPAANPGTGNAPIALGVIPVALAAAAIIAKKRK
jgi:hypothetical protein